MLPCGLKVLAQRVDGPKVARAVPAVAAVCAAAEQAMARSSTRARRCSPSRSGKQCGLPSTVRIPEQPHAWFHPRPIPYRNLASIPACGIGQRRTGTLAASPRTLFRLPQGHELALVAVVGEHLAAGDIEHPG